MTDQNMCEIVVILDRSGSMASVREAMQEGFNGFIAAQQRVPGRCAVTLVQFDSQATETIYQAFDRGRTHRDLTLIKLLIL